MGYSQSGLILLADKIQDSIPAGQCTDTAHQPVHTRTGQIPIQTSRYSSERPMALIACCKRSFRTEAALEQHIQNSTAHSPEHNPNSRNPSFKNDTHSRKGRWSMYPTHHERVSSLLQEDDLYFDFHDVDRAAGCINEYDTNIMGKFICDNKTCGTNGWSSKRIAITIRMYPGEEYNARGAKQAIAKPLHEEKLVRYTKLKFVPMSSLV
ncbi:conserved hypothetical protein [Histoplasma capsulatum var. duboisii H88]|uniref:3CxxC-type domain-containing protein n=2 Tax=Ajellomyces capsulatus TaxID=5037 RepID=F0UCU5_AJEC8|nr:conserved hypothetical protein [Histoplasma capsulatum H143]EGC43371.1 conserved hypothetical protein [Histoplasma capsulatum var. duboisii H88]